MVRKIAVTGGHGFIAGYVIEYLKSLGIQPVTNVRHTEDNPVLKDVEVYNIDILDEGGIYSMCEHVDGVIHLAGLLGTSENMTQAKILTDINVNGALNVLNAVKNWNIGGVFIGVGNIGQLNPYTISKEMAERYALMYAKYMGAKVNVVRAMNAIGPRQKWGKVNKVLPTFINKALRNEKISVYGGKHDCGLMDYVYAGDVAKILVDTLIDPEGAKKINTDDDYPYSYTPPFIYGNVYEAGQGIEITTYELAQKVIELSESKSEILEIPMRLGEANRVRVVADHRYPLEYIPLDEVIKRSIKYYRGLL